MKTNRDTLKLTLFFLLILAFSSCEKQDSIVDQIAFDQDLKAAAAVALDQSTIDQINYLYSLIAEIEALVEEGQLSKGNANALIVKIENSIKSLEKGNDNAASGQIGAFTNEVEDFVENDVIPEEIGGELINKAANYELLSTGSFIDPRDGQEYNVVLIGEQLWMAENLKATKFNDGTEIPLIEDIDEWTNLSTPGYCWYQNDYETYGTVYGALYNWYAVNSGKLAPEGWHIPSDEEWSQLVQTLDPDLISNYTTVESEIAGGMLKETGTEHWNEPNEGASDDFGFKALPGDCRYIYQEHYFLGEFAHWWSSTEFNAEDALLRFVGNWGAWIYRYNADKRYGLSVRCIKD